MTDAILIIGGDQRNAQLHAACARAGLAATACGLGEAADAPDLSAFRWIVGPVPFSEDGRHLYAPLHPAPFAIGDVLAALAPAATLFSGTLPADYRCRCRHVDLTRDTVLYDRNLVPTAEGIVQTLLNHIDVTLAGTRILIAGYGKVGRTVARLLAAIGAQVAVFAAEPGERHEAAAHYRRATLAELADYPIVINTVPAPLFDTPALAALPDGALLLDAASFRGGIAAGSMPPPTLRVLRAPGLPGKKAPRTVAEAMLETILAHIAAHD